MSGDTTDKIGNKEFNYITTVELLKNWFTLKILENSTIYTKLYKKEGYIFF